MVRDSAYGEAARQASSSEPIARPVRYDVDVRGRTQWYLADTIH